MKSLSKFQLIFLIVFVAAVFIAVAMFALGKGGGGGNTATSDVAIWGTFPSATMQTFLQSPDVAAMLQTRKVNVNYVSKPSDTFDQDVIEALAVGRGPDAVILSQDAMLQYMDKIVQIPFASFSQRTFIDSYIQEAGLFLTSQGISALPFTIDPMVMYWNRNMLTSAGIPKPPTLWSQIYLPDGVIAKINKTDVNHNVLKTALSLGTYNNISHAKDILSLLMFQAGSSVVSKDSKGGLVSVLNSTQTQAALNFYTQFADSAKTLYSWNTALPLSRDAFTAGDLALYFGYASELGNISARNPNLNFDVATVPQSQSSNANLTYGKVYGLAILKNSKNINATVNAMVVLTSSSAQSVWSDISGYPPVNIDLLTKSPSSPFMSVFYIAALQSQGWLDPNRASTDAVFRDMINAIISGGAQSGVVSSDGNAKLNQLLKQYQN